MNDIEDVFNAQPPLSEEQLRKLITYFRENRANVAAGYKAAKETVEKSAVLDLSALGIKPKPALAPITLGKQIKRG